MDQPQAVQKCQQDKFDFSRKSDSGGGNQEVQRCEAVRRLWDLIPGRVLDLTKVDPDDGHPWDFRAQEKKNKAEDLVASGSVMLIIGSPLCSPGDNGPVWQGDADEPMDPVNHLRCCTRLYQIQMEQGLYFVHEAARDSTLWEEPCMMKLEKDYRVTSIGILGPQRCEARQFITNAWMLARRLDKCSERTARNGHVVEPGHWCTETIRGFVDQLKLDGRIRDTGTGLVFAVEEGEQEMVFWNSVSGKPLDFEGVLMAREDEMQEFRKYRVYHKVPVQECYENTGKGPIGTKWVDINKGDKEEPDYRSRLVAMEIKKDSRSDFFAATPPLEAKKI